MKIIIGGDFCISPAFVKEDLISKDLISFFEKSELNIVNLECPVITEDNHDKISKIGPHLRTNHEIFKQLNQINIKAVTLANNHIMDYGSKGLLTTIIGCELYNILTIGAGKNIIAASEPKIIEYREIKIALINFCENEFSIASITKAGANPLDIIDNVEKIKYARTIADFVLVLIHGGHEYYNLPSPRMVKQYRFFAENGADVVIGHHTHCISGYEKHKGVPIFYSLGNMLFTNHSNENGWYNGLLLQLEVVKGFPIRWNLIPIIQSKVNFELSLATSDEKEKILKEVDFYSKIISDSKQLNKSWYTFVKKMESQYLNVLSPINLFPGSYTKAILRRLGLNNLIFRKKYVVPILNYIECEAHYDLSKAILQLKSKNDESRIPF